MLHRHVMAPRLADAESTARYRFNKHPSLHLLLFFYDKALARRKTGFGSWIPRYGIHNQDTRTMRALSPFSAAGVGAYPWSCSGSIVLWPNY